MLFRNQISLERYYSDKSVPCEDDCFDTMSLLDGHNYLTDLCWFEVSGHFDSVKRNLIEKGLW